MTYLVGIQQLNSANLAASLYRSGYTNGWRDEKLPLLASLHHLARAKRDKHWSCQAG